ncbi:MAG: flagellar protein [Lachnospiraceae bacterium]|nr:flagellar protein [Lachnospiraceae bacterium]
MNPIVNEFAPLSSTLDDLRSKRDGSNSNSDVNVSFKMIYQNTLDDATSVSFSKHANERISSRQLDLSEDQMKRLNDGVIKAREKNIKDSLIIVDDMSFVVNIPNNKVITALNSQDDRNVFTNIDGAVIS